MKERPILFKADMVRAILEGEKTQTRRQLKKQPLLSSNGILYLGDGQAVECGPDYPDDDSDIRICPYGKPGEVLWVREAFALTEVCGCSDHCLCPASGTPIYRADHDSWGETKWTPSIFMPKSICRLRLNIKRVWVEQLQDISQDDAIDEGIWTMDRINKKCDEKGEDWTYPSEIFKALRS